MQDRKCRACGRWVAVEFIDGGPVRSDDVHTMAPLDGGDVLILHNGCPRGDEESPVLEFRAG